MSVDESWETRDASGSCNYEKLRLITARGETFIQGVRIVTDRGPSDAYYIIIHTCAYYDMERKKL